VPVQFMLGIIQKYHAPWVINLNKTFKKTRKGIFVDRIWYNTKQLATGIVSVFCLGFELPARGIMIQHVTNKDVFLIYRVVLRDLTSSTHFVVIFYRILETSVVDPESDQE
jgi:hypothetical protein